MKAKLLALLLVLSLLLCGCGLSLPPVPSPTAAPTATPMPTPSGLGLDEDIVILYTNDVHCGVDDNLGYTGLAAVLDAYEDSGAHVLLVDAGDAVQGDSIGTLSNGEYIIDIMNRLGYDLAVPGNHEFDYGMEQFNKNVERAEFPYVSCNFVDKDGKTVFQPYTIIDVEGVKLAFVGICTPRTISATTPVYFQNAEGEYIYGFCQDESGEGLYTAVQEAVDAARAEGAQYVIAVAHLGIELDCSPWTSSEVINNTSGIDVMLDGHSHTEIEKELVKNKDGEDVILSSTETKLKNIGCLTIKDDGSFDTKLINDDGMGEFIAGINKQFDELLNTVVASSEVNLLITDPATGERMVRQNETNLGDLCADAFRVMSGADIAFINGGGVREDIPAGEITYGQLLAVQPFNNSLCVAEVTGQEILDSLELGVSKEPGESGEFLHVSGMSYVIDLNVPSTVKVDAEGMFVSVEGDRRVRNVLIGGEPVDPEAVYTLASYDHLLKTGMFTDNVLLQDCTMQDIQVLIGYITDVLGGVVGEGYTEPYGQSRIVMIPAA